MCGGGYNLNEVYASENTSTISIEDPANILSSKEGAGTYVTGNKVTLNGAMASGKTFRGWYKKNDTSYTKVSDNFKYIFEAGGDATYAVDTDYSISYNLDGGTVATANPTSYFMHGSNAITLNNPTKDPSALLDFAGWTGTGLSTTTKTVTIPKGSYGDRSYTANWESALLHVDDPCSKVANIKTFIANNKNTAYSICFQGDANGKFYVGCLNTHRSGRVDYDPAIYNNGTLIYDAGSKNPKANVQGNAEYAAHLGDIMNYILYQTKGSTAGTATSMMRERVRDSGDYVIDYVYNSFVYISEACGSSNEFYCYTTMNNTSHVGYYMDDRIFSCYKYAFWVF